MTVRITVLLVLSAQARETLALWFAVYPISVSQTTHNPVLPDKPISLTVRP